MSSENFNIEKPNYSKITSPALIIGVLGLLVAGYGLFHGLSAGESRPVFSWLIGFSVWFAISIGMFIFLLILHVFDSGWGVVIRRQLEHAVNVFPVLAIVFLPLLLIAWGVIGDNPGILWEWMNLEQILPGAHAKVGDDPLYLSKAGYLNVTFFSLRMIFYFCFYIGIATYLRSKSFGMDKHSTQDAAVSMKTVASIATPVAGLVTTFAAFDLYMSLSYHFFSTIYGVWFFATSMRAGLAVLVLLYVYLCTRGHLKGLYNKSHLYLIGCIFLAFTVFWAYISFCQYFLIYNANIPEETFWHRMRELDHNDVKNTWWWIGLGLIFGNFLIPFLNLLFYKTKVVMSRMVFISVWILLFTISDMYFNILPMKEAAQNSAGYIIRDFSVNIWDLSMIVGVGALWVWSFFKSAEKTLPIPIHDKRIDESIHYHA